MFNSTKSPFKKSSYYSVVGLVPRLIGKMHKLLLLLKTKQIYCQTLTAWCQLVQLKTFWVKMILRVFTPLC